MYQRKNILFVTGNEGKFRETEPLIPGLVKYPVPNLPEIQSLSVQRVVEAKLEAAISSVGTHRSLLIEDTGLSLSALGGFPGALIKFVLESVSLKRITQICESLGNMRAEATTVFGLYIPEGQRTYFFSASIKGSICSPKGKYGFGWDPIFVPNGQAKSFAQMRTIREKSIYSMRHKALLKLTRFLTQLEKA